MTTQARSATRSASGLAEPGERGAISSRDFAAVVARYESPLLRYVARLVNRGPVDVEDIVQETMLRLHRHWLAEGPTSIANVQSWLYRVAHNLAMDLRRKRRRHENGQAMITSISQTRAADQQAADRGIDEAMRREATDRAMNELDRLPDDQRAILLLRIHHDMPLRQIASVLDMSLGNVSYQLNQGLRTLAARLKRSGVI